MKAKNTLASIGCCVIGTNAGRPNYFRDQSDLFRPAVQKTWGHLVRRGTPNLIPVRGGLGGVRILHARPNDPAHIIGSNGL